MCKIMGKTLNKTCKGNHVLLEFLLEVFSRNDFFHEQFSAILKRKFNIFFQSFQQLLTAFTNTFSPFYSIYCYDNRLVNFKPETIYTKRIFLLTSSASNDFLSVCMPRSNHCSYKMRCAISYHLCKLKNVKNTHGGVLLLVKLVTLLYGCCSRFLNCTNDTDVAAALYPPLTLLVLWKKRY